MAELWLAVLAWESYGRREHRRFPCPHTMFAVATILKQVQAIQELNAQDEALAGIVALKEQQRQALLDALAERFARMPGVASVKAVCHWNNISSTLLVVGMKPDPEAEPGSDYELEISISRLLPVCILRWNRVRMEQFLGPDTDPIPVGRQVTTVPPRCVEFQSAAIRLCVAGGLLLWESDAWDKTGLLPRGVDVEELYQLMFWTEVH